MPSFAKLFAFGALIFSAFAATVPTVEHARCPGAKLISSTTIHAGGKDIVYTTHSCTPRTVSRRQTNSTTPVDVCGGSCTISCNQETGILPPISEDCQTIQNAVTILEGTMSPTFLVQPDHLVTLTFGTCSYFFENLGYSELSACWSDLSSLGSADGAACFPPVQPFFPEGLCTAYDGTWAVGATHS